MKPIKPLGFKVLQFLSEKEAVLLADVARKINVTQEHAFVIMGTLRKYEYVDRIPAPIGKRLLRYRYFLTKKGHGFVNIYK